MKKFDLVRASCEDGKSQLFGQFMSSNEGDTEHPPTTYNIKVHGIPGEVTLNALAWKLERTLPDAPGSLIEYRGQLFTLIQNSWVSSRGGDVGPTGSNGHMVKEAVVVYDAGLHTFTTGEAEAR